MKAKTIEIKGKKVEIDSRYLIAIGNQGNHTGYNREWNFIAKCDTVKEARLLCRYYGKDLEDLQPCTWFKYDELEDVFIENTIIGGLNSLSEIY